MSDQNTPVLAPPALAPELAARLACDSVEKAIAELDKRSAELDKRTLEADKLTKELEAVKAERDAFKAQIDKREAEDAASEVDALILANRVSKEQRESALRLYHADRESFRTLYPAQPVAPQARLLESAKLPADQEAPEQPIADNPIEKRAVELQKSGKDYVSAWDQAMNEYRLGQLKAVSG